jgi:uncharacterized repeat protein (TIGR03806 family)
MRSLGLPALALLAAAVAVAPADRPAANRVSWGQPWPDEDPELPEGFTDTVVATGLTGVTALAAAPDGRLFVCEQTGSLRIVKDDKLLPVPFATVEVDSYWERGLIGVTLDPDFPRRPYVYACYVAVKPYSSHRVSRFAAAGDAALPGSEVLLFEGDDQSRLGGTQPGGHQGGALHFGKDGKLYVAIGDQTAGSPAQRLDTLQGKLLRLNPDGSIPDDNPFVRQTTGKCRAIWALGLRNPFTFAVQPGTGRMLINDVGLSRIEEINEGVAGANYGWPESEGPTANPRHRNPLFAYDRNVGRSIAGGTFYDPPVRQFPERYVGKYFFADFMDGWIRVLDPDHPAEAEVFATGLVGPVDLVTAPDGSLYYLNRRAWTIDPKFRPGTGTLHRVRYGANVDTPVPRVRQQPADLTVAEGQPVVLQLAAEGGPPLTFRWQRNGLPVAGADGTVLRLTAATAADDGAEFRCVVSNVHGRTRTRRVTAHVLPLLAPVAPPHVVPGLNYERFTGNGLVVPDVATAMPADAGWVPEVRSPTPPHGHAIQFRGYLRVETDGVYTFDLPAGGPAKLYIGETEVIRAAAGESGSATGAVALRAGPHAIRLIVAARGGGAGLGLHWSGSDFARRPVVPDRLARPDPLTLVPPTITPAGGSFAGPVWVRLDGQVPGAGIRYTTEGREPPRDAPNYGGLVRMDRTATLTAKAVVGNHESEPATARFTIGGSLPYGLPPRQPAVTLNVPADPNGLPPLLSQTGVFRSLGDLSPNPGFIPYDVNSPLWSDGAAKRRWVAVPSGHAIGFSPTGSWSFPAGTVFVKHFELTPEVTGRPAKRLETRLLVVTGPDVGYGVTYRWRPDGQNAELMRNGITEDVPADSTRAVKWSFPSRSECLACHTTTAGFVLGVNTRQLNGPCHHPETGVTDNQLRAWNQIGMFRPALREADIPRLPRLAAVTDEAAPLEHRVRSYLDANCAHCHRPGGARGLFDARFDTPLGKQQIVKGELASADLGPRGAKLVAPGDPGRSHLLERMTRRGDALAMPPLASHRADDAAVAVVTAWVGQLPADKRNQPRPPGEPP